MHLLIMYGMIYETKHSFTVYPITDEDKDY
jgi:hypothetical protein